MSGVAAAESLLAINNLRATLIVAALQGCVSTRKAPRILDEGYGLLDLNDAFGGGGFDLLDSFRNPAGEVEQWFSVR